MKDDDRAPTARFSNRVGFYAKYRPDYPPEAIETLKTEAGLRPTSIVADIGAGTGISTRLFLPHVAKVYAVEPNADMRAEAELESWGDPKFVSVNGTAEATTLPDHSVDFVAAATAFHWFREDDARSEFHRILNPEGLVILMWNMPKMRNSPLVTAYEGLLQKYAVDYTPSLMSQNWNTPAERFYGPGAYQSRVADNFQEFDFEGLRGRLLSASYAPLPGHPNHDPVMVALREVFDDLQKDGRVRFEYDTHVYWGKA